MTVPHLQELARSINQKESELQALRRELETRRNQLADLTRRKDQLLGQLEQVEAQIVALNGGVPTKGKTAKAKAARRRPPVSVADEPSSSQFPARKGSLAELLVTILGQAPEPMTVPQLAREAKRRGFRSSSKIFAKVVEARTYDLQRRGILRHPEGRPGFVLVDSAAGNAAAARRKRYGSGNKKNGSIAPRPKQTPPQVQQRSLRVVLTDLLARSGNPVPARDLAGQALASGYRTNSKNFMEVIWVNLGQMDNVEKVPGEGWRLKKRTR